jgi:hypothetical protein
MPGKRYLSMVANTNFRLFTNAVEIRKATMKVSVEQRIWDMGLEVRGSIWNTLRLPDDVAAEGCLAPSSDNRNARKVEAARWLPDVIKDKSIERGQRRNIDKFNLCVCCARKSIVNVWTAQQHENVFVRRGRRWLAAARARSIALLDVDKHVSGVRRV